MRRLLRTAVMGAVLAGAAALGAAGPASAAVPGTVPVYQRSTWNHSDYLVTTSSEEAKDSYWNDSSSFVFFDGSHAGDSRYRPVYRAYFPAAGKHLVSLDPAWEGAVNEGVLGYRAINRADASLPAGVVDGFAGGSSTCRNSPVDIHRIYAANTALLPDPHRIEADPGMMYGNDRDEGSLGFGPGISCTPLIERTQ